MIYLSNKIKPDCRLEISNCLEKVDKNVYRMVNMTIPTPMIIKTHAKTNPTVIGRLFDEENVMA